jgi:outer membrane protein insertion porin family
MRRSAILLLLAASVFAQTHHAARPASVPAEPQDPEHLKLLAITVRGTQRYSDREIFAAAQLQPGATVTQEELQQASNRLGSSGVFSTVSYQFAGVPGGVRVTFDLTDNPMLLPVTFQNLVWLPDDALVDAIRQRLPLFKGRVPLAGEMSKQVRDAIQAILAEKGVKVSISQMLSADAGQGMTGFAYRTDDVDVHIVAVDYAGRTAMDQELLGGVTDSLKRDHYFMPVTGEAGKHAIEDVYLSQGYLAIKVSDPRVTLADASPTAPAVKLTFPVEEGKQYNLAGVQWNGNTAVTAAELATKLSLLPGRPVNLPRFQRELNDARSLYRKKGYMNVTFEPVPQLHDDGTALITVNVHEGPQYKMGALTVKGLDAATEQKLSAKWAIPAGAAYDDSYPARFVNETIGALPPDSHFQFQQTTKIDDQRHTVDVTIEYKQR